MTRASEIQKTMESVVYTLMELDQRQVFHKPASIDMFGPAFVHYVRPLYCFEGILSDLNTGEYESVEEVFHQLMFMFRNVIDKKKDDAELVDYTEQLKEFCEQLLEATLPVKPECLTPAKRALSPCSNVSKYTDESDNFDQLDYLEEEMKALNDQIALLKQIPNNSFSPHATTEPPTRQPSPVPMTVVEKPKKKFKAMQTTTTTTTTAPQHPISPQAPQLSLPSASSSYSSESSPEPPPKKAKKKVKIVEPTEQELKSPAEIFERMDDIKKERAPKRLSKKEKISLANYIQNVTPEQQRDIIQIMRRYKSEALDESGTDHGEEIEIDVNKMETQLQRTIFRYVTRNVHQSTRAKIKQKCPQLNIPKPARSVN